MIFLFLLLFFGLEGVERREIPLKLTSSVIIPCHIKHQGCLPQLLDYYGNNQTVIPNEVVVSLSSMNEESVTLQENLLNRSWPFSLQIVMHENNLSAGENRNRACEASKGDVLILQDADDLPYPQRVEFVLLLFEQYKVDHLLHGYSIHDPLFFYRKDQLSWHSTEHFCLFSHIANGVPIISRKVFEKIRWTSEFFHGEDVLFNRAVYEQFANTVILENSLYLYRPGFICPCYCF